ncbi:MAG: hypothetical protein GXY34_05185 [Syntrophomonadaceae bacterium]|nr:hypothetical protein [Syntrophomonadaceae bacterium]
MIAYLRNHYRTIIIALLIATVFAALDLYVINLSSYVCGFLLAGIWMEIRAKR